MWSFGGWGRRRGDGKMVAFKIFGGGVKGERIVSAKEAVERAVRELTSLKEVIGRALGVRT